MDAIGLVLLSTIVFAIQNIRVSRPRQSMWASEHSGGEWTRKILNGNEVVATYASRITPSSFRNLVDRLKNNCGPFAGLKNGRSIFVDEQVIMFLQLLGQRPFTRGMMINFQHSGSTISNYIHEVLDRVCALSNEYIKLPSNTARDHSRIAESGDGIYREFTGCIGAIDGSLIPIFVPESRAGPWRPRNGQASENVLGVADFDGRFVYVRAGWEGSAHDSAVYQNARIPWT